MAVEWLVYGWVTAQGKHRVGECTRKMWTEEWNKPDTRKNLELAECKLFAEGLTEAQARVMVQLTKED